mgnify:CR=1 FL=1
MVATVSGFLLWLGTFFQLVLLVADDMRRVPHEYIESALTLGAQPRQVLSDVAFRLIRLEVRQALAAVKR